MIQVHTNRGSFMKVMPGARILKMVAMMLIAPITEDNPMRCTAKITNGKASWVCNIRGGYMVQPPAGPPPGSNRVSSNRLKAKGSIQKLQLFRRGNAISGAPIIIGIIQLARPTAPGITTPKIIISACMVVMELKNWGSTYCSPGCINSRRTTRAMAPPTRNISRENSRYSVPMSLWLVVNSQRIRPACGPW